VTKKAHITSRPGYEVGEKVLGLCGKEFKVKQLWADVPKEKQICRECVDTALDALTQSDELIENARRRMILLTLRTKMLDEILNPEDDTLLDIINDVDLAHVAELAGRALEKEARKKAKVTCICTWTSQENFEVDPACPIHGGHLDAEPVEVPAIEDVELPKEDVKPEVTE
jgi:hypothetical protein